jgi:hypothetical protein
MNTYASDDSSLKTALFLLADVESIYQSYDDVLQRVTAKLRRASVA